MPDYKKIELENQKLQSTVDVLLKKLIKQENNFKETLANSMAWGALQEQRAAQAVSRLEAINNSFSWRVISKINNKLDKFPRLRLSIKRGVKLLIWTAKGQLPSKLREFREAQKAQAAGNGIDFTAIEKVGSTAFCIEHTTLPSTLLDRILFFMRQKGPVNLILALNFYAEKKAEFIALEYAQAYAKGNPDSSVLIVLTDNGLKRKIPKLPSNIMIIDLTNETPDVKAREDYLFLIIRMVPLKTLHIVNSIIAYNLLKRLSNSFLSKTNVLASVYSLQYDWHEDTKIIDYGAEFLPENIDKIDCIVTDNQILTVEGPLKLGIVDHSNKFRLVYNKSKLDQVISIDDSFSLLKSRLFTEKDKKKLIVHWAGPIERSQRPDLLVEIATLTEDFCEFQVFPSSVFDEEYEALLRQCRNINFREAYISSLEWDAEEKGNVFLFTSRQEGMPDPLIDASYLGYPVIASNVGGVGELINSETGWPIDKFAPATVYVDALKQIFNNHDEANKRTERLIKLVHSRHNINAYLKALAQIPGYERV